MLAPVLVRSAGLARLALAVEATARELRRRRKVADVLPLEEATTRFVGRVFREQGRRLAPRLRGITLDASGVALRALDAAWAEVAAEVAASFTRGMTEALRASYASGAARFMTEGTGQFVREASLTFTGPPEQAEIPLDALGHAQLADTVFDVRNPRAEAFLAGHAADLVAGVDEETRSTLRSIVTQGVAAGRSSERIGRDITARFGEMAVGRPQQHIDSRAHGIAVTEMAFGYEAGQRAVADQVAGVGVPVQKSWLTVGDSRVDPICAGNAGQGWIPLEDSFESGASEPPAHPYCRCTTLYEPVLPPEPLTAPVTPAPAPTAIPAPPEPAPAPRAPRAPRARPTPAPEPVVRAEPPAPEPASGMPSAVRLMQDTSELGDRYGRAIDSRKVVSDRIKAVTAETKAAAAVRGATPAAFVTEMEAAMRRTLAQAQPTIAINETPLRKVLAEGRFKSQFETATSQGTLSPWARGKAEAAMFGYAENLPTAERPIYGYMSERGSPFTSKGDLRLSHDGADGYGTVKVILRDEVRARTTFTGGDSLGVEYMPSAVEDPRSWSVRTWGGKTQPVGADFRGWADSTIYVEAQYHGGVGVEDIAEVWFGKAPTPTTAAALRDAGFTQARENGHFVYRR